MYVMYIHIHYILYIIIYTIYTLYTHLHLTLEASCEKYHCCAFPRPREGSRQTLATGEGEKPVKPLDDLCMMNRSHPLFIRHY
jgi:hypothetical protein